MKTLTILTASALLVATSAMADPQAPPVASGFVGPPDAGGNCTTFVIGGVRMSFDDNPLNNRNGRFAAVNDAFLNHYPIKVWVATQVGSFNESLNSVVCTPGGQNQAGQKTMITPWFITPAN